MRLTDHTLDNSGRPRLVLSPREWLYLLSLLVPFTLYDLLLKGLLVASRPGETGLLGGLELIRSDILFGLGFALLWLGLFAVVRRGAVRWVVVVLFHATTILVALVVTAAYQFYETTGSTLDADVVLYFLSTPGDLKGVVGSAVTPALLVVLSLTLLYAVFGPWLVMRFVGRWRGWPTGVRPLRISWLDFLAAFLVAYALLSFSLFSGASSAGASFSRDAFVNLMLTGFDNPTPSVNTASVREGLPTNTHLAPTAQTKRRNVVVIHLESTRERSVTPYNEDIKTTPYLNDLAQKSLVAERAYTVVPHTTNALTAVLCGIDPPLDPKGTKSLGDSIPAPCLPNLLKEQGYRSVYFTSSVQTFERRPDLIRQMGYGEFYPVETMDTKGFQQANYFGYEDDVMLKPSEKWLQKNGKKGPFLATYETITPHHQYLAPTRYGRKGFAKDDTLNRYLNAVRYDDFFVKNLIEQYKKLGLYKNTVFVIYGDHGEGFGEHGLYQHDDTIYEEGVRIPLIIHDPGRFENGQRVEAPVDQLDVLPTLFDLLGFGVKGGSYPGTSLLDSPPKDRTLFFSCWAKNGCLASLKGDKKYIYFYGNQPEEVYDLSKDPLEKKNIAGEVPSGELKERRDALLKWSTRVDAAYGTP
jgi:lipoteichoic acid synthase